MASFTQNISGVINCFGPEQSTKWGAPMLWGTDTWGDSVSSTFGLPIRTLSYFSDNGPTFTDTFSNRYILGAVTNVASFVQTGRQESLRDGSGKYFYILPGGVTNDENAVIASYVTVAAGAQTWTLFSTSTASWVTQ